VGRERGDAAGARDRNRPQRQSVALLRDYFVLLDVRDENKR
jgi:hypothetical protein